MLIGKNLCELACAVQTVVENRNDFTAPSSEMWVKGNMFNIAGVDDFNIMPFFHEQLAATLDIPKAYYDRMREKDVPLWENNVNTWLSKATDDRLVRTVRGDARAFLSVKYRPFDNDMLLNTTLPILSEYPDMEVVSSEVTERRMYLQVVFPGLQGEARKGDVIQSGLILSNSEVGFGAASIFPLIYRPMQQNGMIRDTAFAKDYIEGQMDMEYFFADSEIPDNNSFLLKIGDTIQEIFSKGTWDKTMKRLKMAAENKISEKSLVSIVEAVTNRYSMPVSSRDSILKNLANGEDLSQWGLANSISLLGSSTDDYDKAIEYESIGGKIIDLSAKEWKVLA